MSVTDQCFERLLTMQDANGGWGYGVGRTPQVEPTCLALLALATAGTRYAARIEAGLGYLRSVQDVDGVFRVAGGRNEAVWPTALAAFTLASLNGGNAALYRAAGWLLHITGKPVPDPAAYRRDFDVDPEIAGWPWGEGNFSWVEPTAWACMALTRGGWGEHSRVREGLRLLLDRAFDEGGVNYGNRQVFGRSTEPVPATTALMLLAFAGRDDHPRLQAARRYLAGQAGVGAHDLENLCWMRLALGHWPADGDALTVLPGLAERIGEAHAARRQQAHFADAPVREALAALALAVPAVQPFSRPSGLPTPPIPDSVSRIGRRSWSERARTAVRKWGVRALGLLRPAPPQSAVHIARATSYDADLFAVVREQYAGFREQVPLAGKRVVLKPNLVEYHPDKVINTHPAVVAAMIDLCREEGAAEIIVAEGPGHWRNAEYLVEASGLGEVLRRRGVRFVDLNHDDPVRLPNLGLLTGLEYLYFARTVAAADVLVSLAKLKTHHWAGVTLACKNLFGTLPGICYGWPKNELHWRGIEKSIVDIALTRTPDLSVVDGVIGMEGDGPLNGEPKPLGVLVMGTDPLAVDATCCRLMEIDPHRVPHLALGESRRLGLLAEARIVQRGESIAARRSRFALLPRFEFLRAAPGSTPSGKQQPVGIN